MIENILTFTDDLDLKRSQTCKITCWAISRFLLDKLSPAFNTEQLWSAPVRDENKVKIKHGFNGELYIWTIAAHGHCTDRDMNEYSQFIQYINLSKTNQVS